VIRLDGIDSGLDEPADPLVVLIQSRVRQRRHPAGGVNFVEHHLRGGAGARDEGRAAATEPALEGL
jgi:hypothetical protein